MTTGCWQGCSDSTSSKYGEHAPRMILCACADPGHHQTDSFVGTFLFWGTSPWTSIAADFDLPLEKKGFSGKKKVSACPVQQRLAGG
jgi:hypothetical protein